MQEADFKAKTSKHESDQQNRQNLDDHHKTSFFCQKGVYKNPRAQQEAKYGEE